MFEYEFRLAVQCVDAPHVDRVLAAVGGSISPLKILYADPHFRFREGRWEMKRRLSSRAVFHDGVWFLWVESEEIAFERWNRATHTKFLNSVGQRLNPMRVESRRELGIEGARLYGFQKENVYGIVFEMEWDVFPRQQKNALPDASLLERLSAFRAVYTRLQSLPPVPYTLQPIGRKPVKPVGSIPEEGPYLYAVKHDGVFGLIQTHDNHVVELWEGHKRVYKKMTGLGTGFVYGAERMKNGTVILLDVYQVRGSKAVVSQSVLTDYLESLHLPPGYEIQKYYQTAHSIPPRHKGDGVIIHDVSKDEIFKFKSKQTVDLVHFNGVFLLPNGETQPCPVDRLRNGAVYECDLDFNPIKRRRDRFWGNNEGQIKNILDVLTT